jgi:hypothetical protein
VKSDNPEISTIIFGRRISVGEILENHLVDVGRFVDKLSDEPQVGDLVTIVLNYCLIVTDGGAK